MVDGDNDVSGFFTGDDFGEMFHVGQFYRHELFDGPPCPVGFDEVNGPAGRFCDVGTGDLGVVRDDGGVRRKT